MLTKEMSVWAEVGVAKLTPDECNFVNIVFGCFPSESKGVTLLLALNPSSVSIPSAAGAPWIDRNLPALCGPDSRRF